ncbi:MAG: AraC family transcriptional regulator [Bacteroides sp.]|nr:AraC family transcriptional regulator [Bacteroides sp.]
MDQIPRPTDFVSMQEIAKYVNNESSTEEIIVFDQGIVRENEKFFPIKNEKLLPIRIDALIISLCTAGSGKISIDLREYELKRNSLIMIQPKNYIYLSKYSKDFKCSVLICSKHVVENVLPKLTDILPFLLQNRTLPVTQLSEEEATGIRHFYEFIKSKLHGPRTRFEKQKINSLLQAIFYELMDIKEAHSSKVVESSRTRKEEIMAKFIIAVSEEFRTERQVAYYAQKLCISPKHLSSVVKEISGRTAGEWIENYVVMESKILLKTTDMTIQEIAVYLNFANQSFFGKYFKQHTGCSPTSYRKKTSPGK